MTRGHEGNRLRCLREVSGLFKTKTRCNRGLHGLRVVPGLGCRLSKMKKIICLKINIQFYFNDYYRCELTSDVELPDHKHGALDKTWRRLFEVKTFLSLPKFSLTTLFFNHPTLWPFYLILCHPTVRYHAANAFGGTLVQTTLLLCDHLLSSTVVYNDRKLDALCQHAVWYVHSQPSYCVTIQYLPL